MSGSGVTYYNEELKMLLRLLKALPDTIPEGDLHDFRHYVIGQLINCWHQTHSVIGFTAF
jgi:hypothetical protein